MYKKVHFLYIINDPMIRISIYLHKCPLLPLAVTGVQTADAVRRLWFCMVLWSVVLGWLFGHYMFWPMNHTWLLCLDLCAYFWKSYRLLQQMWMTSNF